VLRQVVEQGNRLTTSNTSPKAHIECGPMMFAQSIEQRYRGVRMTVRGEAAICGVRLAAVGPVRF
jgi:hypothetical protein